VRTWAWKLLKSVRLSKVTLSSASTRLISSGELRSVRRIGGCIAFEADGNLECLVNLCMARLCDGHVDKTGSVMQRLPVAGVGAVLFQAVPGFFEKPRIVYAHGFVSLPKGE